MGWSGLERNKLDYILTDLLPVEISELFSFSQLYAFLLEKDSQKKVDNLVREIKQNKAKGNLSMFKDGWSTMPLKYRILKGNGTMREMSVIQPFSALNLFLFIEYSQFTQLSLIIVLLQKIQFGSYFFSIIDVPSTYISIGSFSVIPNLFLNSIGITTLPNSSTLLIIPVAFNDITS